MDYISGWCKSDVRLDGYTTIVTGSNSGIGKQTALDFYKRGAKVILACRDIKKAEETKKEIEEQAGKKLKKGVLTVEQIDLASLKSVREFASRVLASETKIQILVNNAGIMLYPQAKTEDGFEMHMGTNHFGHALLTLLLLPRIVQSAPSRIIFVSSVAHLFSGVDLNDLNYEKSYYAPFIAYARSKTANVMFARALAEKLKENKINNVTTYSLHPGIIKSGIGRHFDETSWLFNTLYNNYFLRLFYKSSLCGAQTTIYCAVDEKCANESGLYYSECGVAFMLCRSFNEAQTSKLWDITIQMLQLSDYDPFGNLFEDGNKHLLM